MKYDGALTRMEENLFMSQEGKKLVYQIGDYFIDSGAGTGKISLWLEEELKNKVENISCKLNKDTNRLNLLFLKTWLVRCVAGGCINKQTILITDKQTEK